MKTLNNFTSIPSVPIVFLDLDETLVNKDTNSLWLEWRIKNKKDVKGTLELLIGIHNLFYYRKGKLTDNKMNRYFWARTIGITENEYNKMSHNFFNEKGIHHIYSDAIKLIDTLKKTCSNIVMITGQDDFVTYPFYKYFNINDYISNKRIIKNNRFIGFESPNCYGEGKIFLAQKYANDKGYNLNDCAFFSDSISDYPLLKNVNYPVAVNPDQELYKKAVELNWPIIHFLE